MVTLADNSVGATCSLAPRINLTAVYKGRKTADRTAAERRRSTFLSW